MKKEKRDSQKVVSLFPTFRDGSLNRSKMDFWLSGVSDVLMDNFYPDVFGTARQKVNKLVNSVPIDNMIKSVDYLDGFQYTGGELNFFLHPEGYVNVTLGTTGNRIFNYVYYYTDHLGNIRLTYTKDMVSNQLKIMDENHYYPFGLKHQKYTSPGSLDLKAESEDIARPGYVTSTPFMYRYNGKEYQDELGLNMYDMDMRQYDPAIARWVVLDPVIHHSMSPYNAFDNNPVFWADPSGADSIFDQQGTSYSSITTATGVSISAGGAEKKNDGKIQINGQNKNSITINIGGDTDYTADAPFDIEESIILDIESLISDFNPNNFAIGYSIGLSGSAAAALGGGGSVSLSVVQFSNSEYGGYNYVYAQGELTGYDGATIGASLNIQGSIFIMSNSNAGYTTSGNPNSYAGRASATGIGADVKAEIGGGANIFAFRSNGWHGVGIGGNVGVGGQVNYLSTFHSESNSVMLNNQKLTRERSFGDRAINNSGGSRMIGQAVYQYLTK